MGNVDEVDHVADDDENGLCNYLNMQFVCSFPADMPICIELQRRQLFTPLPGILTCCTVTKAALSKLSVICAYYLPSDLFSTLITVC